MSVSSPKQQVFICYRREDSAPYAGRLHDALASHIGPASVFMDVELAPGVDFVERITEVIAGCLAVIVVIGPRWASVEGEDGGRRLEDPDDTVRLEVENGLRFAQVTVPVLVSGATMPRREDLPPPLQQLCRRNAQELSEARWSYDVGRLIDALDELLPGQSPPPGAPGAEIPTPPPVHRPSPPPRPVGGAVVAEGALLAAAVAAVARLIGERIPDPGQPGATETGAEVAERVAAVVLRRMETWALVAAALAIWLALRLRRGDPVREGVRGLMIGALAGALGAALFALPVYLPEKAVSDATRSWLEVPSLALTGGMIGWLIGSLWLRRRRFVGLACGATAGATYQLLAIATGWKHAGAGQIALSFAIVAAAVTALTLAVMLALDRGEAPAAAEARSP